MLQNALKLTNKNLACVKYAVFTELLALHASCGMKCNWYQQALIKFGMLYFKVLLELYIKLSGMDR